MKFYPTHLAYAPFAGFLTVHKLVRALALTGFLGLGALCSTAAASGLVSGNKNIGPIWFIGDSITQSNADLDPNGSPRKSLHDLLNTNGYTFSYTGHSTDNRDGLPNDPNFTSHSGISGAVIGTPDNGRYNHTVQAPIMWVTGRLNTIKPRVVLIMLGTNDVEVIANLLPETPARLSNLIDTLYALPGFGNPTVFVASIPPNHRTLQRTANVATFNAAVPSVVNAQADRGRDVRFVDIFNPLNSNFDVNMQPDNLHTNAAGNGVMAQQWFDAINAVAGIATAAPVITASQSSLGRVGVDFRYQIKASQNPTSYALSSGSLPPGITLNTSTGRLSGLPTAPGAYTPVFTATNAFGTSATVALALNVAPADTGSLIVYEPFAYPLGTINPNPDSGLNGDNGLPATNAGGDRSGAGTGLRNIWSNSVTTSAALTYSEGTKTFVTSGLGATKNATGDIIPAFLYESMVTDPFLNLRVGGSGGNLGKDGTVIYFSALVRIGTFNAADRARLTLSSGVNQLYVGLNGSDGNWTLASQNTATSNTNNATPVTANTTTLLVGRYTFNPSGTNDTFDLWVNPALGSPLGTPAASISAANLDFNGFGARSNVVNQLQFDELRLGTSLSSVTPHTQPTDPVGPAAPSGLIATSINTSRITLSWNDNANNEAGFKLERSTLSTVGWTQIAILAPNTTSYTDVGLDVGVPYYYRVRSTNFAVDSAYTSIANATPGASGGSAPVITSGQSASGTMSSSFSYQIVASNSPASYALASGSLPAGISLNTGTGLLTGTPSATGTFTPNFTATNASGTSPAVALTITISANTTPTNGLVPNNKSIGKIWFIGDSITQSNADGDPNGSPRKSLYDLLIANSYTFKYTGHFTDNIDGLPGSPDGLQDYVFHSGLSGSLIGNSSSGRQGMTALVTERWAMQNGYLFLNKPNVVLIMLGTNDIDAFGEPGIPATADAPARMTTLINTVYGLSGIGTPTVLIATIAPNTITPTKTANVIAYNAALPAVVSAQVALGRDVHLVDHYTPLNNAIATSMMPDKLHPNATGNGIIAQQWYNAINAIAGSPATIPAAPSGLTATANSSSQITLNWTDNSSNETGFRVERSPNGSSGWTQIATPSANATSYADTGLTASTMYHYRVRATNTAGDSANTSVANATTSAPAAPAAPSGLTATANSSSQITLNWTDNSSNETGFRVERSPNGATGWTQIATPSANATSFANTGLTAVTTYHYRLRATNATGDSAYSNMANATTTAAPVGNLIAYDGFAGGTVFNGGTGWSGNWSAGINAGANLTFGSLNTTGAGANINGYWNSTSIRSLSTPVTSGTVWFSWVQNGGSAASEFKQIRIMNGANEVLVVGQHNDANTFKLYNGNSDYTARANTATAITGTHFVVLSINLSNSTFNLYIDPTGLGTGAAPSSVASATFSRGGSISNITGLQSVGGGDTFAWDEVRVGTTWSDVSPVPVAPLTGVQTFRTTYGLAPNGSGDLLTPAGDGVANLLKYAFNMVGTGTGQGINLSAANSSVVTANSSAGLPLVDVDGTGKLRVTYVRRKSTSNSGISYVVEFSDTLANGTWVVNASATTVVTSIDTTFERVVVTDASALAKRFVRVRVSTP